MNPAEMNLYDQGQEGVVPTKFATGPAGCGKTYNVKQAIVNDPTFGILAATTGIAAVNLGAITINSLLKYFDTRSLEEAFFNGWLVRTLDTIASDYKWLVIDEVSMLDGRQLDIIYQAVKQLNEFRKIRGDNPLGIYLTGDFCQLPPVKAKWAFEAECWPEFEATTERMTKIWRQSDVKFLEALNHLRGGRGMVGATILSQLGVNFVKAHSTNFDGTTIIAKNEAVNNFNWLCHSRIPGVPITVYSDRWMTKGRQMPGEWDNVPPNLSLKKGSLVMILSNSMTREGILEYVNGDCGHVIDFEPDPFYPHDGTFQIELIRNESIVSVGRIRRQVAQKQPPDEILNEYPGVGEEELRTKSFVPGEPKWDESYGKEGAWITGELTFFPLRLAYASTVHKTQGLTLDRVQIDLNQHFMSAPGMCYVAISRCKTPQGLTIVGTPALLGSRVKTDPAVQRWL